ncbi:hypothetical protein EON83_12295 [bacterium]|nr:MAG: hypothetical protein EON83_12295 [bacterium]
MKQTMALRHFGAIGTRKTSTSVAAFMVVLGGLHFTTSAQAVVQQNAAQKTVTIADDAGNLKLRLNYDNQCVLDEVTVRGRQVLAPSGTASGILIGGQWYTTRRGIAAPKVVAGKDSVEVSGIVFGKAGEEIRETWNFKVLSDRIAWRISRSYPKQVDVQDAAFPSWNFANMTTWTGGILDNGGVVWNKYLENPNTTYGAHAGMVTLWNREKNDCLRITPTLGQGLHGTVRFSHQPQPTGAEFTFNYAVSNDELKPKYNLNRYLGDRQDLWAPFQEQAGEQSAEFTLQALDYAQTYDRGTIKGLDASSIREMMNTAGRYGVIDNKLVGGNGWRSGYICLHEQWFAQIGMVLNDPLYDTNYSQALDYYRDNAIKPDGRVLSRWKYDAGDAMGGTYTPKGFYEAQWGYLLDSQTDYVINVSEQFDLTGDTKWLAGQKQTCEKVLDYLLRREVGNSGVVAMLTDSRHEHKGSDWFDIVWAAHRNGIVNAELYYALTMWAEHEETLGDTQKAAYYRTFAARLKENFNRPIEEGGLWDAKNQWYVYWLDKDGSAHGNNLFTAVNFAAISYGLCDDKERQKVILDRIESEMQKENLFHWPTNFFPFEADEVSGGNMPFPNYENGEIFMSWGEIAVRAYAKYNPALALKYIKKALDRYEKDGLSFQRYDRRTAAGEGDDILSGNCMTVVGLYRNIYGLQPKGNRLYLEPHLVPELNGTQLPYQLGGRNYKIDLDTTGSAITTQGVTVRAASPFALAATDSGAQYFPAQSKQWALAVTPPAAKGKSATPRTISVQIQSWPTEGDVPRTWSESAVGVKGKTTHIVAALRPNAAYKLKVDGKAKTLRSDSEGKLTFTASPKANKATAFDLSAVTP